MSYTGDGVAQTQAFAHARKQLASNDKIAQLEGFTTRIPTDGDKHVSVFSQVRGELYATLQIDSGLTRAIVGQAPVDNLDTSMRAGARGPTSIDDPVARERISHFDQYVSNRS
jgi:catalase